MNPNTIGLWLASLAVMTLLSLLLTSIRGVRADLKEYIKDTGTEIRALSKLTEKHENTLYGANGRGGLVDVVDRLEST